MYDTAIDQFKPVFTTMVSYLKPAAKSRLGVRGCYLPISRAFIALFDVLKLENNFAALFQNLFSRNKSLYWCRKSIGCNVLNTKTSGFVTRICEMKFGL